MSKEGGYTSQGWTHIPLLNRRESKDAYAPQREHFPETMKVGEADDKHDFPVQG